jgi:DNA adenine methylase
MALFRYSGGKAKLVKKIIPHIVIPDDEMVFVEPFVGGGSVALMVATRHPKINIVLNDLDPEIHAFWNMVANGSDEELSVLKERIRVCQPTIQQYNALKAVEPADSVDRAFRTLFFNRTSFSSSNGKRPLGGWNQGEDGAIDSRWNAKRLVAGLTKARLLLAKRTVVLNEDFERVIEIAQKNWVMYCDPPYYKAGNQLYNHRWSDADHVRLCELLKKTPADWVLSYDFHPRIVELYDHGMTRSFPMPVTYSISKRPVVEAIFVPVHRENVSPKGFTVPRNFSEFFQKFPNLVRLYVERKMRWDSKFAEKKGEIFTVFEAQVADYTQELLLHLAALPQDSKYRAMGFNDPIQVFNPGMWGTITQGRFLAYVVMLLNNKFSTLRTKEHRDVLPFADAPLGAVSNKLVDFSETAPDFQTYRNYVAEQRPSLLPAFDSFFDWDSRHDVIGYETARARLIHLLRERFVHGRFPLRKEYKTKRHTRTLQSHQK